MGEKVKFKVKTDKDGLTAESLAHEAARFLDIDVPEVIQPYEVEV